MKNATFHEHLLEMNRIDGLRLATAQMIISSSRANGYLAGGDILRMATNIIKFENLVTTNAMPRDRRSMFRVLSLSMEDLISNPHNSTLRFVDFIFGGGGDAVPNKLRVEAVAEFEREKTRGTSKKNPHVTQGRHVDREALHQYLREDDAFGPVLVEIEKLVERALSLSRSTLSSAPSTSSSMTLT